MIYRARNYKNRKELDAAILSVFGDEPNRNRERIDTIEGTEEELKRLALSEKVTVYGIKIKKK